MARQTAVTDPRNAGSLQWIQTVLPWLNTKYKVLHAYEECGNLTQTDKPTSYRDLQFCTFYIMTEKGINIWTENWDIKVK